MAELADAYGLGPYRETCGGSTPPGRTMNFVQKNFLLFVVFLTGACVLVIEIAALRVLAPYFGNTIFSASSVITVILAALSIGYYTGGRIADRFLSVRLFYTIILASGCAVLVFQLIGFLLLPFIGRWFSIVTGPLFSSALLFFLPGLLLGTLSPFVIALQKAKFPEEGVGTISGKVFFWSTAGSIAGSLATGFVFIPRFGVNEIMIATGVTLIGLALVGLFKERTLSGLHLEKFGVFVTFLLVALFAVVFVSEDNVLYSKDGVYEKVTIFEGEREGRTARFLRQDRAISGAMFLNADAHVYEYSEYYQLYQLFYPDIQRVLVIGGGAYTVPRELFHEKEDVHIDVVEIEPVLFELAQQFFRLPESDRVRNYKEDGRRFLSRAEHTYDFIFGDAYQSIYSVPTHLTTQEFFELVYAKLSENGIFLMNVIGSLGEKEASFALAEIKTLQSVFPNVYVFATKSPNIKTSQNIMLLGHKSKKRADFQHKFFTNHPNEFFRNLPHKEVALSQLNLASQPLLVDNFAPVDYLVGKTLREEF